MVETAMKIKKVKAESVRDAMHQIRREFGEDAIILNTRKLRPGKEQDSNAQVEVTAGIYQEPSSEQSPKTNGSSEITQSADSSAFSQLDDPGGREKTDSGVDPTEETRQMRETMMKMQETIERLTIDLQHPDVRELPDFYREWYLYLVNQDVEGYLVKSVIREAMNIYGKDASSEEIRGFLEQYIEKIFMESPANMVENRQQVIALVGPTGVGKTTTIAKLATQKSLEEGRRVALITADTYRVAATDQITTFAHLLDVPIEVVYTPEEMADAIRKFADYDYIYIDTTGRSQKDRENIEQIQAMLESASPDEMHLVLSATTSTGTLRSIVNKFSFLPVTDILISKIDEAESAGSILAMLQQYSWPVSYFTNGQNVPEDIMVGTAAGYCELLLGDKA